MPSAPATDLRLAWRAIPGAAASQDGGRSVRRRVAWALVRDLLAQEGWPEAALTNPCPQCGGPHGPIQVSGPWLAAVSYAGSTAVAALHPRTIGGVAITGFGIDAEPFDDPVRTAAGPVPGGLLRWVRVEATLKAAGQGLRADPSSVEIEETAQGWAARMPGNGGVFQGGEPVPGPPGVLVSAAVRVAEAAPARRATR